jgi:glycosyltransferase involved in cell wall biosynthesis
MEILIIKSFVKNNKSYIYIYIYMKSRRKFINKLHAFSPSIVTPPSSQTDTLNMSQSYLIEPCLEEEMIELFDVDAYLQDYPDVRNAFASTNTKMSIGKPANINPLQVFNHYLQFGRNEGRKAYCIRQNGEKVLYDGFNFEAYNKVCESAYYSRVNNELNGYIHYLNTIKTNPKPLLLHVKSSVNVFPEPLKNQGFIAMLQRELTNFDAWKYKKAHGKNGSAKELFIDYVSSNFDSLMAPMKEAERKVALQTELKLLTPNIDIYLISHDNSNSGSVNMLKYFKNTYELNNYNVIYFLLNEWCGKNVKSINGSNNIDLIDYINKNSLEKNRDPIVICNTIVCYEIIKTIRKTNIKHYWYLHEWLQHPTWTDFINNINENDHGLLSSPTIPIFICDQSKQNFKSYIHNVNDNYLLISNSISTKELDKKVNEQISFQKQSDDFLISLIGHIDERKNQQGFIDEVFYICKQKHKNLKLLLVGNEHQPLNFNRDNDSIIIKSDVSNALPYINISDIVISYSNNEVYPLNIMEAFYCGKPVIVTDVGGVSNLIRHNFNGYIYNLNNPQCFIGKIDYLIKNPHILHFNCINARNFFINNLSQETAYGIQFPPKLYKTSHIENDYNVNKFNPEDFINNLKFKRVCFIHFANISNDDIGYVKILYDQIQYIKSCELYNNLDYIFISMLGEFNDIIVKINDPKIKCIYYSPNIKEWEFPSFVNMKLFADIIPFNVQILYIHTKGALRKPHSYDWRKYLEYFMIEKHDICIKSLENYKCIGTSKHYYCHPVNKYRNLYSGNFWWSNSNYMKNLPQICSLKKCNDRYSIEHWLVGNLNKYDYRNFTTIFPYHKNDLYSYSIKPHEYRLDLIRDSVIKNIEKSNGIEIPIVGLYYIWLGGGYKSIVQQQLDTLKKSGLYDASSKILCFISGEDKEHYINYLNTFDKLEIIYSKDNLFEKFALNNYKQYITFEKYNLYYFHSKGTSHSNNKCIEDWVKYLNYFILGKWKICTELLNYFDCVGCALKQFPKKHYSGNFWWSNSENLNKLSVIGNGYLDPEMYVCSDPHVNCVEIHNSSINHGNTEYPIAKYIQISDYELLDNINTVPTYNKGDDKCIIHEKDIFNINQSFMQDLSKELPVLIHYDLFKLYMTNTRFEEKNLYELYEKLITIKMDNNCPVHEYNQGLKEGIQLNDVYQILIDNIEI